MFTTDETILQLISENDRIFDEFNPISDFNRGADKEAERPITGTASFFKNKFILIYGI